MKVITKLILLVSFFAMIGSTYAASNVNVCHKGRESINISRSALQAHLNHGDEQRTCKNIPRAIALFRCGGAELLITSVSTSIGVPQSEGLLAVDSSCSNSIQFLINKGYTSTHVNSVYDADLPGTITDYGFSGPRQQERR